MSEWNIQKAVYSALSGISASVYDHTPQDSSFPYVVIGEDVVNEWGTDTEDGYESLITLHVWSRYRGKKEAKRIQSEIYGKLHRKEISISGQHVVSLLFESSEIILDADGLTYHGINDYRLLSQVT